MAATLSLFLLITLFPFPAFAYVSWSIDCGASNTFFDSNFISWQGDNTLISTGEVRTVESNTYHKTSSTLRVFTSGNKNCYVLKGEKGAKLFVRPSFFYGNYDGKSSPPSFNLELDGNDWGKVVSDMDSYFYHEITYVSKGDSISLCLVQTDPDQYPFISALEVRTFDSKMYQFIKPDQALDLHMRIAFGANEVVSYPSDPYFRIWGTAKLGLGVEPVTSTAFFIDTTRVPDKPPMAAVKNAVSVISGWTLKWYISSRLDSTPSHVYMNMYFSEVRGDLDVTLDTRSFNAYIEDGSTIIDSLMNIVPEYGIATEAYFYDFTASNSTTIRLTATSDSTLPPIVNAMEVFKIIDYTIYELATPPPPPTTTSPSTKTNTSTPATNNTPTSFNRAPSSGKKKSKLPVILGAGVPMFMLLAAFVVVLVTMQQKRKQAAMTIAGAAANPGGNNGYGAGQHNNANGQIMMGGNFGQQTGNEFNVNG